MNRARRERRAVRASYVRFVVRSLGADPVEQLATRAEIEDKIEVVRRLQSESLLAGTIVRG